MLLTRKLFVFLVLLLLSGDLLVQICAKRGGSGWFGRGSSSFSRGRKPSSSYHSKYSQPSSTARKPSAPPSAPPAEPGFRPAAASPPKSTLENQKPIGWNVPNNQQAPQLPGQPIASNNFAKQQPSAPVYANQPPPTYNGAQQPAYQAPPAYSPQHPPAYSPHQPPPPYYSHPQAAPPPPAYYQPNPYNTSGFQTGGFQPPKRSGFGLGSIAGSSTLGNVLTGLTLWQVLKGNSNRGGYGGGGGGGGGGGDVESGESGAKTVNIYNNYYNGSAIPINEPITSTDNAPIKTRYENGTLVLQDDTIIYPNGTLVLRNGTVFNTIADIPLQAAPINGSVAAPAPVTVAPVFLTSLLPAV